MTDLTTGTPVPQQTNRVYVLDDGYVELRGFFHTEDEILEITRVTTAKAGFRRSWNKKLLARLLEEGHTSPFDFAEVWLYVRIPIALQRQWFRHRTAARGEVPLDSEDPKTNSFHAMQEFSMRYAGSDGTFYLPAVDAMNRQSDDNHQGRSAALIDSPEEIRRRMAGDMQASVAQYRYMMGQYQLAREVARLVLPVATYTEFHWQQNLNNLLHWLGLRRDAGAQQEIREYARGVERLVEGIYPRIYEVWDDIASGAHLTRTDLEELLPLLQGKVLSPRLYKKVVK